MPTAVELATFRSPIDLATHSPEMALAEATTYLTFILGFLHARRNGPAHLLFFLIAFLAASFVDPICLISPQIRNYYHSHASILLWDRHVAPWQFPFFADLAYVGGAMVWSLGLDLVSETLLIAFVSSYTFYVFDLYACRWLLYQWHNSDPLYTERTLCVPLASSMWVMTYSMTASLLARLCARLVHARGLEWTPWLWAAVLPACVLIFLPLHIVPISLFYFPTFLLGFGSYAVVLCFGWAGLGFSAYRTRLFAVRSPQDRAIGWALAQSLVWFGGCVAALLLIDPGSVVSTCVHEPFGGAELCGETESYLFGLGERKRYVCENELSWWKIIPTPGTLALPKPGGDRYTIQGLPMDAHSFSHIATANALGLSIHLVLLALYLIPPSSKKKSKSL